jgi:FkbH-like protein
MRTRSRSAVTSDATNREPIATMPLWLSPLQRDPVNAAPPFPRIDAVVTASELPKLSRAVRRRLASWAKSRRRTTISRWYASQFDEARIAHFAIAGVDAETRRDIRPLFLEPLFELFLAYLQTGEDRYRDMYLDERLRYAPHQAAPSVRAEFFRQVISRDEAALLESAETDGELGLGLRAFLADLHAPLVGAPSGTPIRMLALGDCLMNELRVFLTNRCRRANLPLDFRAVYFSAALGKRISTDRTLSFMQRNPVDLIAMSFLSYEGIPPYSSFLRDADKLSGEALDQRVTELAGVMREFIRELRDHTDAPFLVHNASGLPLTRARRFVPLLSAISPGRRRALSKLNAAISEIVENTPNTLLIDEASVASQRGYRASTANVVPRSRVRHALFHASRFGEYLATPYTDILRSFHELRNTKVLLVDFDNTLWKGVMADGPVEHYVQLQSLLCRVKDAGILLVALSKNDPTNVRWSEMVLQPDDFVLHKINWDLKVQSIQTAALELDLGLDSFVLVDDNPVERELVRTQLPEVRTLDSLDQFTWCSIERMLQFPNTKQTEEARTRTELYRQAAQRREALTRAFDYPAMMTALGLEVQFGRANARNLDRIVELVQRTNQFNTTTIRHTKQALQGLLSSDQHAVYVASLRDKFGRLGLVAVVIIRRKDDERVIDSFVMSCRAMGFDLERLILRGVIDAERGAARFIGRFIPTDRNTPAMDLFPSNGFVQRSDTDWVLDATGALPEMPSWFTVQGFER